jgi:hypothetical protein
MVEYLQAENAHIREANQQNHVRLERHELVWTKFREVTSWFGRTYPQSDDVFVIVIVFVHARNLSIIRKVSTVQCHLASA